MSRSSAGGARQVCGMVVSGGHQERAQPTVVAPSTAIPVQSTQCLPRDGWRVLLYVRCIQSGFETWGVLVQALNAGLMLLL